MTRDLKRFGWRFYLVVLLATVALAYFVVPWRVVLEDQLRNALISQGLKEANFTITNVGLESATLENVKLGRDKPLLLSKITIHYSLRELMTGKLGSVELSGPDLNIRQEDKLWKIAGLEEWQASRVSDAPFLLPVSNEALAATPFDALLVEGGRLRITTSAWQMEAPFNLSLLRDAQPLFSVKSQTIDFKSGSISGSTGALALEVKANPDKGQWEGNWSLPSIQIAGIKDDLPVLDGKGTVTAFADRVEVRGRLASADNSYSLSFGTNTDLVSPNKSTLTILETMMPWMQGHLSAQQITIPLGEPKPVQVGLNLQNVSIAALLQELTGKETVATGSLSGILPITFSQKGDLSVQDAVLQTNETGTIKLPPESIPGDNPQVAFVREVLMDFHYTNLSAKIENTQDNKLSVTLVIEGNNPSVQAGRPVKINVHLKGDLLNFIEQNILWLYDPIKLMERGKHETN